MISTGQGGLIVTNERQLADRVIRLKDFGRLSGGADVHNHFGINSKFTDFQAVIGIEQLKKIKKRVEIKRNLYRKYYDSLSDIKNIEIITGNLLDITPWFMDIYVEDRLGLKQYLSDNNIGTRVIYPLICDQPIYSEIAGDFPMARKYSDKGLWLPSSVTLTDEDVRYICKKIKDFFA